MAIVAIFDFPGEPVDKYEKVFEAGGPAVFQQPSRLHHVCYRTDSGFTVADVWTDEQALAAFGEIIMPARSVNVASNDVSGCFRFTLSVSGSTASVEAMFATSPLRTDFGSLAIRSKLIRAASALNSVPSWNFTPERSLRMSVFGSGVCQDSARLG